MLRMGIRDHLVRFTVRPWRVVVTTRAGRLRHAGVWHLLSPMNERGALAWWLPMPRSRWSRFLSAVFAVWLALVMGEAGLVHHRCPMHDGSDAGHATGHVGAHQSHARAGASHAGQSDSDAPAGRGHHVCTCIGACSVSCGSAPLPIPALLPAATVAFTTVAPAVSPMTAAAPAPVPFALPFANAPPRAIA